MFTSWIWIALTWETAIEHFHFRNIEMEDMLVSYQSNPAGVELFSHVNTFVGFILHILRTEISASEVKSTHYKRSVGFCIG